MQRALAWFKSTYLTVDVRSLAAGRIAIAIALLVSLFNRLIQLPYFYTNEGLLPNHAVLWSPVYPYELSFFLCLSHAHEALVGFGVCFTAFVALLLGYKTRIAQIASFICFLSLRNRLPSLLNAGDVVLGLLAFWTLFLPVGGRYSVDAARLRLHQTSSSSRAETTKSTVASLAAFALFLQVAAIYALNYLQKDGETWVTGSALHYTLHQDRLVTSFGVFLREALSIRQSASLAKLTLIIEALIPLCVLSPLATCGTRRVGALMIIALHAAFGACLNLGAFVPAMIALGVLMIPGNDWEHIVRAGGRVGIPDPFAAIAKHGERWLCALPKRSEWQRPMLREVLAAAALVLAGYQLLRENRWFADVRPPENKAMDAAVIYLGLFQGWSMFAPDAPRTDLNVSVDAVTVDGRHVDPLNAVASENHMPGLQIPSQLSQPWLFTSYVAHVPTSPQFNSMLIDWIGRYHLRTGQEDDRIVAFEAYVVEDDSPPPGEQIPRNTRWQRFIAHRFEPSLPFQPR
jgi:hypothetical protein